MKKVILMCLFTCIFTAIIGTFVLGLSEEVTNNKDNLEDNRKNIGIESLIIEYEQLCDKNFVKIIPHEYKLNNSSIIKDKFLYTYKNNNRIGKISTIGSSEKINISGAGRIKIVPSWELENGSIVSSKNSNIYNYNC